MRLEAFEGRESEHGPGAARHKSRRTSETCLRTTDTPASKRSEITRSRSRPICSPPSFDTQLSSPRRHRGGIESALALSLSPAMDPSKVSSNKCREQPSVRRLLLPASSARRAVSRQMGLMGDELTRRSHASFVSGSAARVAAWHAQIWTLALHHPAWPDESGACWLPDAETIGPVVPLSAMSASCGGRAGRRESAPVRLALTTQLLR